MRNLVWTESCWPVVLNQQWGRDERVHESAQDPCWLSWECGRLPGVGRPTGCPRVCEQTGPNREAAVHGAPAQTYKQCPRLQTSGHKRARPQSLLCWAGWGPPRYPFVGNMAEGVSCLAVVLGPEEKMRPRSTQRPHQQCALLKHMLALAHCYFFLCSFASSPLDLCAQGVCNALTCTLPDGEGGISGTRFCHPALFLSATTSCTPRQRKQSRPLGETAPTKPAAW